MSLSVRATLLVPLDGYLDVIEIRRPRGLRTLQLSPEILTAVWYECRKRRMLAMLMLPDLLESVGVV